MHCGADESAAAFASLPPGACVLGTQGSDGPDRVTRKVYDVWGEVLQVQRAYGTSSQQNEVTYTYTPEWQGADFGGRQWQHQLSPL